MFNSFRRSDAARKHLATVCAEDPERIEKVRLIMERDLGRTVTPEEAEDFMFKLVDFYRSLAQGRKLIISESSYE